MGCWNHVGLWAWRLVAEDAPIVLTGESPVTATVIIGCAGLVPLSGMLAMAAAGDAAGDSGGDACKGIWSMIGWLLHKSSSNELSKLVHFAKVQHVDVVWVN